MNMEQGESLSVFCLRKKKREYATYARRQRQHDGSLKRIWFCSVSASRCQTLLSLLLLFFSSFLRSAPFLVFCPTVHKQTNKQKESKGGLFFTIARSRTEIELLIETRDHRCDPLCRCGGGGGGLPPRPRLHCPSSPLPRSTQALFNDGALRMGAKA